MKKGKLLITFLVSLMLVLGMGTLQASAASRPGQVKNVKVTAYGASSHKITWSKVKGATGYQVYCRDYSSGSKLFKKVKTVKGASKVTCIIGSRKQGKAYAYVVRAYKKSGSKVSYGKLSSYAYGFIKKTATAGKTNTNTNTNTNTTAAAATVSGSVLKNPSTSQKYKKVFGDSSLRMRYPGAYYKSASKAAANMKTITVKTWDFKNGKSGEKITRTWTIKVHKNLASTVQQIFKEIYEGSEKFPIHELGGYDWRGGHSEHNIGTAIDINWTENYMVNIATGKVTAGKYWKPGKDPYSIPKDGEVAKIFKKYGFSQGDWGNSKDYMHFSYFGT